MSSWKACTNKKLRDSEQFSESPEEQGGPTSAARRQIEEEQTVAVVKVIPQERISERTVEQIAGVPVIAKQLTRVDMFSPNPILLCGHLSCCKVSRSVLSSNFGAHGLRSRGSHFFITPRDGPFLSRIFYVVPLGEFDCVIRSQFSNFPQNRFFSEGNLGTHNPIV